MMKKNEMVDCETDYDHEMKMRWWMMRWWMMRWMVMRFQFLPYLIFLKFHRPILKDDEIE